MPLWSKFELWNLYREYDSYKLDSKGFGATLGYPLWQYVTGYVGYRLSIDDVRDVLDTASYYIKKQAGRNDEQRRHPQRDPGLDGRCDVSLHRIEEQRLGGIYRRHPLGRCQFTRYGLTSSWFFAAAPGYRLRRPRKDRLYDSPTRARRSRSIERYYLGGINSLRGLREVGPRDPATGDVIGGLTMLNFNFEYVFPLIKNAGMKGLVFFDTGNTWESGYHLGDMRKTAGVGIRWYSPIGPLRLEWGYVLDRKEGESASRWEFTIGMFM